MMQFATIIRARAPRCQCQEHGVVAAQVPWAEPHGRFTLMFEAFALTVTLFCAGDGDSEGGLADD